MALTFSAPFWLSFYLTPLPHGTWNHLSLASLGGIQKETIIKSTWGSSNRTAQRTKLVRRGFRPADRFEQRITQPDQASPSEQATQEGGHCSLVETASSHLRGRNRPTRRGRAFVFATQDPGTVGPNARVTTPKKVEVAVRRNSLRRSAPGHCRHLPSTRNSNDQLAPQR